MNETFRIKAVNNSMRIKALPTPDGTIDVPANGSIEADILPLTQERIDEFRIVHDVVITRVKAKKGKSEDKGKLNRTVLEMAVETAKAALDKAGEGSDLDAQAAAQQKYDEARRALEAFED